MIEFIIGLLLGMMIMVVVRKFESLNGSITVKENELGTEIYSISLNDYIDPIETKRVILKVINKNTQEKQSLL